MRLKYSKLQFGGIVSGGTINMPVPVENVKTPRIPIDISTNANQFFNPEKPVVDKSKFKPDLDEFFKSLKERGHTNEVNEIQKIKNRLDQELLSLNDLDILSGSDKFAKIITSYSQLTSPAMVNQLVQSKKRTDDSFAIATQKKNLGQMNVKDGKVKVFDKENKLYELPLLEALKLQREGKVVIPTNSKLWQERDTNPNLVNNANLSQELTYGVNIDDIVQKWRNNLSSLGKTESGGKHKRAIDMISQGLASQNSQFIQDVMNGYKKDNNINQVRAALDASINMLDKEEIDSLYAFAAGRLLARGEDITPENLKKNMYNSLFNLSDSKIDVSTYSESEIGAPSLTDLTKITMRTGVGNNKDADIGFYEAAYNFNGDKLEFVLQSPNETSRGSEIRMVGANLGNPVRIKDGVPQYELLISSEKFNNPNSPLVKGNFGYTPTGKKISLDMMVPISDEKSQSAAIVYQLTDKATGKPVVSTYSSLKELYEKASGGKKFTNDEEALDYIRRQGKYDVKPYIYMTVATINKDKPGIFSGSEFDDDVESGNARKLEDSNLRDHLLKVFRMTKKEGEKTSDLRDIEDDEIVVTSIFIPASNPSNFRYQDKNPIFYPKENAQMQNQFNNFAYYGSNNTPVQVQKFDTPR